MTGDARTRAAERVLRDMAARGVTLDADGDHLRVRAPKGALSEADRRALAELKPELLERVLAGDRAAPIAPRPHDPRPPLSFNQERLWFLDQLEGARAVYHVPGAAWLRGPLRVDALTTALSRLVERHESLRTTFANEVGRPWQQIRSSAFHWEVCDLRHAADPERTAEARAGAFVREPFDLERGPLVRALLIAAGPDTHLLALSLHHIVADGWSVRVLLRELQACYRAACRGEEPVLPPLPIQYADFAAWQRDQLSGARRSRLLDYWRTVLDGAPEVLDLPTDRSRPPMSSFRGAIERFAIDAETVRSVRQLAAAHDATLFQALLAAFHLLLHRHSGQDSIVVGTPHANRTHPHLEPVVGYVVNTLPLRADFSEGQTFVDLLAAVKTTTVAAYEHADLPFGLLVAELSPARSLGHHPVFQAMFALQPPPLDALYLDTVSLEETSLDLGVAKFDLYLSLQERGDGTIVGEWEYATDLFDAATIRSTAAQYGVLLRSACSEPNQRVARLPLLTPAEANEMIALGRGDALAWPETESLVSLVRAQCARTPEAIAVIDEEGDLTYGELAAAAGRLAGRLRSLQVGREQRVGVCTGRSRHMIVALLGVLEAGAAYVPLDPAYPAERLTFIAADAELSLLVTDSSVAAALPAGADVVFVDRDEPPTQRTAASPSNDPEPAQLAYVIYTSGSTGQPKGIEIEHRNAVSMLAWARSVFTPADLRGTLASTSVCFDLSVFEIFLPLVSGGTVIVADNALALPSHPAAAYVTLINTVPSAIAELVRSGGIPPAVRIVNLAGEPLRQALVDQLYELPHIERVYDLYGPGETTTYSTCALRTRGGIDTIGRPIANARVYVLDAEQAPVPRGVPGEIYIAGPGVTRGYLERETLTAARYLRAACNGERMYRTGDVGRFLADGTLQFRGRSDDQVKIRGFRIEPGEVASVLRQHHDVADCIVHAGDDGRGGRRLVAYLVGSAPVEALRDHAARLLPSYMIPAAFVRLETLPRTPNGKIDRRALPDPSDAETIDERRIADPVTDAERALSAVWAEVLHRERVGVTDNFFQIGGDSILAVQVVARARMAGLTLAPAMLFEHQTIRALAAAASTHAMVAADDREAGDVPLTPIQQWCLATPGPDPQHFSQWVLLDVPDTVPSEVIRSAVEQLPYRHGALRLRFGLTEAGWRQWYGGVSGAISWQTAPADRDIAGLAAALSSAFDLAAGPIGAAVLLHDDGERHRLLLVLHHLVVDGVSWRIIVDDVAALCEAAARKEPVPTAIRTASYKRWALTLASTAASATRIHVEPAARFGFYRDRRFVTGTIGAETAASLRSAASRVYGARFDEILAAAIGNALHVWAPSRAHTIDIERHGRDDVALDTSSTVGWFTSIGAVALPMAVEPARAIVEAMAACRRARVTPFETAGDVSLNYLGRIDTVRGWTFADIGLTASPERPRPHRLAVAAASRRDELTWQIEYAAGVDDEASAAVLSTLIEEHLERLAAHLREPAVAAHRNVEHITAVAPAQEGILLHSLLSKQPGTYVTQVALQIAGLLDLNRVQAAWREVARRHAALRSAFVRDASGGFLQITLRDVAPTIELQDLRGQTSEVVDRFQQDEHARPFALETAPLVRVAVAQVNGDSWRCVLTAHHAVLDGWSLAVVLRDFAALIADARANTALPELGPWPEYASAAMPPVLSADEAFWVEELAAAVEPTETPWGRGPSHEAASHQTLNVAFEDERFAKVDHFARQHGLTLHTMLLGAWALVLGRAADAEVVTFGGVVSGRSATTVSGIDAAAGLFVKTVPVVIELADALVPVEWLAAIQRRHAARDAHAHVPLVRIHELGPGPRGTPLFDTLLVLENYPVDAALFEPFGGLRVADVQVTERPHYPLTVSATATDRLRVSAIFDAQRFSRAEVTSILNRLEIVLDRLCDPSIHRVGDIDILTQQEERQVLVEWNATNRDYPSGTIVDLFEAQVDRTPAAPAVMFEGGSLSYVQLDARANQVAHMLRAKGVVCGSLVAVSLERSLELLVALWGVLKAGAAYVPIDPGYPAQRRDVMLQDAGARLLLDRATVLEASAYADVRLARDWGGEAVAYMIYTSGSTGRPKGALNTHAGIANRLRWMQEAFPLDATDAVLQKTPISFDVSVWELFWPLLTGARLVVARPDGHVDPGYLAEIIARDQVTTVHFVPSMLRAFLDAADLRKCGSLRRVIASGEALAPDLARNSREALAAELHNLYGPTEAAVDVTWWPVPRDGPISTVPIGRPIANTTTYILDRRRRPMPPGLPGELFLGGVQVGLGYWNRPELTAERFIEDPFAAAPGGRLYRTGDRARWLPDGTIEYLGRLDSQVKLRGMRIELGEIEAALRSQDAVADAVVTVHGREADALLVAYVVASNGDAALEATVRAALRERLPEAMVPSFIVAMDALPRLPNGKLDRASLPAPGRPREPGQVSDPTSDLERTIAAIWSDVLGSDRFGRTDNFFDVGGHSLRMLRVHARVQQAIGREVRLVDFFEHPTIAALARHLSGVALKRAVARPAAHTSGRVPDIAVIGMACRLPGARTVEAFWDNLVAARDSITRFTDQELLAAGESPERIQDPRYVKAAPVVADADAFDAGFFDIPPREAEILDPQQRVFLECAWEAFERAGYDPARIGRPVGVFAGAGMNLYALARLHHDSVRAAYGTFPLMIASDKDYLPTRVAYKLNLTGPAVAVQTACSTSLVAIALACDAIQRGDCDLALAGGVTIKFPQTGYLYEEDMIFSPDGRTRTFDAQSAGVVLGGGVGAVLLKRLDAALADGDHIHAVVKGTALNNDGSSKVGYTAPGVEGQAAVIRKALERAGVDPSTIGMVEAHGTATPIGDPIEVAALTRAWREWTDVTGFCALGSVKTNIGHTDAAAGVAGFMKAVLAVEHGRIPAHLHFTAPNPRLELERSPFWVPRETLDWPGGGPRRAAVSSFGIGGTNAHVVIESPPQAAATEARQGWHLIAVSARSSTALDAATAQLADALERDGGPDLADAAFTLLDGRRRFQYRRALACGDRADAIAQLRASTATITSTSENRPVVFAFSAAGTHAPGIMRGLYDGFAAFRDAFDEAAALLRPRGLDIPRAAFGGDDVALQAQAVQHPVLVAQQYALVQLWRSVGVQPAAVLGSSLGEYAAACAAGVLTLPEMLAAVADRAALLDRAPAGAMLAVRLPEAEARARLSGSLSIAVVATPSSVVVSGTPDDVDRIEAMLAADNIDARRVAVGVPAHSGLLRGVARALGARMTGVPLAAPSMPIVSTLTGTWMTAADAMSPDYWARQLCETVQLSSAIEQVLTAHLDAVIIEIGAGRSLASAVLSHPARSEGHHVLSSVRHALDTADDERFFVNAVAGAWSAGVNVDARGLYARARRVALPTYPFERRRFLVAGPSTEAAGTGANGWLYVPTWERSAVMAPAAGVDGRWLVIGDRAAAGEVVDELRARGAEVAYAPHPGVASRERFARLLDQHGGPPAHLIHVCTPADAGSSPLEGPFFGPVFLAQALGDVPCHLTLVTNSAARVTGAEAIDPFMATAAGPARVVPQELEQLRTLHIDLHGHPSDAVQVVNEAAAGTTGTVALRNGLRWTRRFAPLSRRSRGADHVPLTAGATYIVVGGLGGVGLEIAEAIARAVESPHLVLAGRSIDETRARLVSARLAAAGALVTTVSADLSRADEVRRLFAEAERNGGAIRGVVHAGGIAGGGTIALRERDAMEAEFAAKIRGTELLYEQVRGRSVDFLLLCSSTSAFTGGVGSVAYTAANAFQDAFAQRCASDGDHRVRAVNWYRWQGVGMSLEVERLHAELTGERLLDGITAEGGREAFLDALAAGGVEQIAVCPHDLHALERRTRTMPRFDSVRAKDVQARPEGGAPFAAPRTETETIVAEVWRDVLGVDAVGIGDEFHLLGGDSLLAMRIVARLRTALSTPLSVRALYETRTVEALARHLDAVRWVRDSSSDPVADADVGHETGVV